MFVVLVVVGVGVVVVVVSDADGSVCMFTHLANASKKLQANLKRANLETWACTNPGSFPTPVLT